jgi:hypothetical protein
MTWRFVSGVFVIPNQVLNLIQDLRFRDLVFWLMNLCLKARPKGGILYWYLVITISLP